MHVKEYGVVAVMTVFALLLQYTGIYFLVKNYIRRRRGYAARILLYHKVNNSSKYLTVSTEKFDRQISYLKNNCTVVSLGELVECLTAKEITEDLVVITFDDGYKDNFDNALPILRKYKLPACFFVTSDIIGTAKTFKWDDDLELDCPKMTWDDVREIKQLRYDIGAHTVNHSDLGDIPLSSARFEIRSPKDRIAREVNVEVKFFSYPFGRKVNVTQPIIEEVKEAGYVCCCSAYGGANFSNSNLFDLKRQGVNDYWTFYIFKKYLEGYLDFLHVFRG